MGNRTLLAYIFVPIFVFGFNFAKAQGRGNGQLQLSDPCVMNPNSAGCSGSSSSSTAKPHTTSASSVVNCPVKSLTYCIKERPIIATKCVTATSFGDAGAKCGGGVVWDLSNPIYGVNANGVWMCSGNSDSKRSICQGADKKYKLQWVATSSSDGYCYQMDHGTKDVCDFTDLAKVEDDTTTCTGDNQQSTPDANGICQCKDGYEFTKDTGGGHSKDCVAKATTPATPAVAATPGVSEAMKKCVSDWQTKAQSCKTDGAAAKLRCDQANKSNKEVTDVENIPGQFANTYIQAKTGSGMVSECIKASALASGSKLAMDSLKNSCDDESTKCETSCPKDADTAMSQMQKDCSQYFGATTNSGNDMNENQTFFNQNAPAIVATFQEGQKTCYQEAPVNKGILNDALLGLANAVMKGQTCVCQLLTSSSGNCSNLPTAAQCAANPALAGCPAVVATDVCTMGSANYNPTSCNCVQNPTATGCPQALAANPALSGFGGANVPNSSGNGGVSVGAPTGGATGGTPDIDLSGAKTPDVASGKNNAQGLGAGFTGGGGGGGGGGMAAPGGGGGEGGGAGAGEGAGAASGLGAVFGQAKSIVGNMLGIGAQKGVTKMDSKMTPDMNKFKPSGLRGVASGGTAGGTKNMDIWQMMHNTYDANTPTFIPTP